MSPRAAFRRCIAFPCANPAAPGRGVCATHGRLAMRALDKRRGSASHRGYGDRWTKYREAFLTTYSTCGDRPLEAPITTDSVCRVHGLSMMPAEVVDHIVPVRGREDPRFWQSSNHQALCTRCHNAKRARESRDALPR